MKIVAKDQVVKALKASVGGENVKKVLNKEEKQL